MSVVVPGKAAVSVVVPGKASVSVVVPGNATETRLGSLWLQCFMRDFKAFLLEELATVDTWILEHNHYNDDKIFQDLTFPAAETAPIPIASAL